MSQAAQSTIPTNVEDSGLTPIEHTDFLNLIIAAIYSQHSGATAPAYVSAGMAWYDTTTNDLKVNDGTDNLRLVQVLDAVPASATDTGRAGQIAFDASFIYLCTATDTWVRSAVAAW